jgi:Protein of unknown function (DUF1822)
MTDASIETLDLSDFQADRLDAIAFTPNHITAAQQLSQSAPARAQWATYLNALAATGLTQWLSQRQLAAQPIATNTLQVNGFRIAAIVANDEDEVLLPQVLLDTDACHLYVAVGVDDEQGQAYIVGSVRYDQLKSRSLSTEDQSYRLPIDELDPGSNQLLLTLRCSEPAFIPLPVSIGVQVAAAAHSVAQTKIRVGQWLNRQLDDLAAELSWVLMPPMTPQTAGLRSASATLTPNNSLNSSLAQALGTIAQQGIAISAQAQTAYYDLILSEPALRLYAVVEQLDQTEWSLLLVLGTPDGSALPANLQLRVSDGGLRPTGGHRQILVEESVEVARSQSYLYTQLIGEMDEGFQVAVTLPIGTVHVFPEFVFG